MGSQPHNLVLSTETMFSKLVFSFLIIFIINSSSGLFFGGGKSKSQCRSNRDCPRLRSGVGHCREAFDASCNWEICLVATMETAVDSSPAPRVSMILTAMEMIDTATSTSPVKLDLEETDQDTGPGDTDKYLMDMK